MFRALFTSTALLLVLAPHASSGDEKLVGVIAPPFLQDYMKSPCPCEFDLGKQIDGEPGLFIDQNAERQPAFAKIDGSVLRLERSEPFRYKCRRDEEVRGAWKGHGVDLQIRLTTDGPGEESCWFHGEMTVTTDKRRETRHIVGACGC